MRRPGSRLTWDERRIIDGVLRDFPAICLCMRQRREYLESLEHSRGSDAGRIQGGESMPSQERLLVALTSDVEYCELSSIHEILAEGMQDLSDTMYEVVEAVHFRRLSPSEASEQLHKGDRWIRTRRTLIYDVMVNPVFRVYPVVRRWREREQRRREEAIRKLLCG